MSTLHITAAGTAVQQDDPADEAEFLLWQRERAYRASQAACEAAQAALASACRPLEPARAAWRAVAARVDVFAPGEMQAARSSPEGRVVLVVWPEGPGRGPDPMVTLGLAHHEARRLLYSLERALGEVRP